MTSNGNLERSMTMVSFGRAVGNISQASLASSAHSPPPSVTQCNTAPPVPRIPSTYQTAAVSSAEQYVPPSRSSSASSSSLELPIQAPPTPTGEAPRLCQGPSQHIIAMPSPGVMSMQASIAGTMTSPMQTFRPVIKRKPVPNTRYAEIRASVQAQDGDSMPPPAPTSAEFPGDPLEQRHLATTNSTLPSEEEVQAYFAELDKIKVAAKKKDPYHRTIHDAYPHVFKPKPKPVQMPKLKRNQTSRAGEVFSNALRGFKKAFKSFAAHRQRPVGGPNGVGMSIPIQNSFHDFHAQGQRFQGVLHPDLKAIPVSEARAKHVGQHKSIETGSAAMRMRSVAPPRHQISNATNRAPFGDFNFDFNANDLFDPSIEDPVKSPLPRPRIRRARKGGNRGSSKLLPRLPPEAWLPPDAPGGYFDSPKPPRQGPPPQIPERNTRRPDASICESADSPAEQAAGSNSHQRPGLDDTHQAAGEYHFDSIDDVVAEDSELTEGDKHWANEELHRMDEILDRERRASDGSIIIDTFPHNAHTSWRATERTSDHVIHSDYRRFSRDVHDGDRNQDGAGLLMERLSRQMRGL